MPSSNTLATSRRTGELWILAKTVSSTIQSLVVLISNATFMRLSFLLLYANAVIVVQVLPALERQ
jgi:hypothetical protein